MSGEEWARGYVCEDGPPQLVIFGPGLRYGNDKDWQIVKPSNEAFRALWGSHLLVAYVGASGRLHLLWPSLYTPMQIELVYAAWRGSQ